MAFLKKLSVLFVIHLFASIACEDHLLIDQLRLDFLNLEEKLWKFVLWESSSVMPEEAQKHLLKNFFRFDRKLRQIPDDALRGLEPIRQTHSFLILYSELKNTENLYEKYRQFQRQVKSNNLNKTNEFSYEIQSSDMIRDILNPKTGANATVHKIYELAFGNGNMAMEVFELFVKDFYCKDFFQSPQQIYYNLYNAIALNGLKDYMMLQYAYLSGRIKERGNYAALSTETKINFEKRVNETMSIFRGAMELARQSLWRCDPKQHIEGETYEEITRLLQGHIQNEVDMNAGGTCRDNCALYSLSTSHGCYDKNSKYCVEMERCTGKIIGCQFVENHMDICLSRDSSRRYDYIQYQSGKTMGKKVSCWKKPVKSWWRWLVHCSYCLCLCDEQGPKSDRFINLRPVLADVQNNMVVTGLRFVKSNRIIHLQIQEGKLLPYGYIDNTTVRWVPVHDYKITDPGVYSGKDYFTMSYENRSLALDEIQTDQQNYILTGVGFVFKDGKLRFQIQVRPFNWKNGTVSQNISTDMYLSSGGKYQIDLSHADVPVLSPPSELNYDSDTYVEFTHTGVEADAAQTTIPFIDIQPVYSKPSVPLKGAGIHYRGNKGYGGFIAPKIVTYSYSDLILVQFPENENRNEEPLKA